MGEGKSHLRTVTQPSLTTQRGPISDLACRADGLSRAVLPSRIFAEVHIFDVKRTDSGYLGNVLA
jgi:hypothetical protein